MNEIQLVYEIITEVWKIAKKYKCEQLNNDEWQNFVDDGYALRKKYACKGKEIDLLVVELFMAILNYYERKNRL